MQSETTQSINSPGVFSLKLKDYLVFTKFKLTSLVVFSAVLGFLLGADTLNWTKLAWLIIGGFLVTGASNGFNQIIEKDYDAIMSRTQNRPMPTERMSTTEGFILSMILGILGVSILWFFLNTLSGLLGLLSLLMYVLLYTPLKRVTPLAVFVGAFPGAVPPMLGWVAATSTFGLEPGLLFFAQFMWQFPHFWAIAWKSHDDYTKAGFKMLPSASGKTKASAFQIMIYSLFTIPSGILPWVFGITGIISALIAIALGIWLLIISMQLYQTLEDKFATRLMFASFFYLPLLQLTYLFDKI